MKFRELLLTCIRFGLELSTSHKYDNIINIYDPWQAVNVGFISKADGDLTLTKSYKYTELSVEELRDIFDAAGYPRRYKNEYNVPETLNDKILELYILWTMNTDMPATTQLDGLAFDIEKLGVPRLPIAMSIVKGTVVIAFVNEHNGVSLFTPDSKKPVGA